MIPIADDADVPPFPGTPPSFGLELLLGTLLPGALWFTPDPPLLLLPFPPLLLVLLVLGLLLLLLLLLLL